MEAKTKKTVIISSIAASLLLFAIVLIIIILLASSTCSLQSSEPIIDWSKLNNVVTSNYLTMANFAGHLVYNEDPTSNSTDIYMPLSLRSVEARSQMGDQIMMMDLTCAKLQFRIRQKEKTNQVVEARIKLEKGNLGFNECDVNEIYYIVYPSDKHYTCTHELKFNCYADKKKTFGKQVLIATLVIEGIEFEVGGNPIDHKQGTYTLPGTVCSSSGQ